MRVDFHPQAVAELEGSTEWYEKQSPMAARDFLVSVDLAIDTVSKNPERFEKIDDRHRRCAVRGFPFQIVYRGDESRIVIIAIAHAMRQPEYWSDRT